MLIPLPLICMRMTGWIPFAMASLPWVASLPTPARERTAHDGDATRKRARAGSSGTRGARRVIRRLGLPTPSSRSPSTTAFVAELSPPAGGSGEGRVESPLERRARPRRRRSLLVQRLPVADAALQELRPLRDGGQRVGRLGQEPPQGGMV